MACGCNKKKVARTSATRRTVANTMTNRQKLTQQTQKVYTSSAQKKPVRQTV